jgi:hypothetical protein
MPEKKSKAAQTMPRKLIRRTCQYARVAMEVMVGVQSGTLLNALRVQLIFLSSYLLVF